MLLCSDTWKEPNSYIHFKPITFLLFLVTIKIHQLTDLNSWDYKWSHLDYKIQGSEQQDCFQKRTESKWVHFLFFVCLFWFIKQNLKWDRKHHVKLAFSPVFLFQDLFWHLMLCLQKWIFIPFYLERRIKIQNRRNLSLSHPEPLLCRWENWSCKGWGTYSGVIYPVNGSSQAIPDLCALSMACPAFTPCSTKVLKTLNFRILYLAMIFPDN